MKSVIKAILVLAAIASSDAQQLNSQDMAGLKWTRLSTLTPAEQKVGFFSFISGKLVLKGRPIKVKGVPVRDGLFAHAPSRIVYNISGSGYSTLRGRAALEDDMFGEVQFEIIGDGRQLWQSGVIKMENARPAKDAAYAISIAGISKLELIVSDLGNQDSDHSIWMNPELGKK